MKTYILSIAGVILLSAVVAMIAPNGKMGAFVRGMMKLLILAVVVTPLISVMKKGDFDFSSSELATDGAFLEQCAELVSTGDEAEINAFIEETYAVTALSAAVRSADGRYALEKITVKITDFGIFGQDEHIDIIREIKEGLEERYGCTAEVYEEHSEVAG